MANELLLSSLEELVPAIRARREEIENARRLPADLVEDIRRTGVLALQAPRALGGAEAEPLDILDAIETVARGDGSTGWCVMLAVAGLGATGMLPEAGAKEILRDVNVPTAGVFAPTGTAVRVDGGVRVSGRWHFASGITHSRWVWVGCVVMENGSPKMTPMGPEVVCAWMPVDAVQIHDTWFVSGLCGTGSNDITAVDVFVPDRLIFSFVDTTQHRKEPLYRLPLAWFVAQLAAVALGIARSALDEITEAAQSRVPTMSMAVLADRPAAQIELARAEATLGAARSFLRDAVAGMWRDVVAGGTASLKRIAYNRIAAAGAVDAAAAVTRVAGLLAGGGAISTKSSLQRHMRDADAIAHHFTVSPHVWEDAGRVLMGRQPTAPMF
jgi:alkylation response protein AidB-like acyl-CoA dehydrogenase